MRLSWNPPPALRVWLSHWGGIMILNRLRAASNDHPIARDSFLRNVRKRSLGRRPDNTSATKDTDENRT